MERDSPVSGREALSVGAIGGGPGTDRRWVAAVMALMRAVKEARSLVDSPLAVNVVFQIPGPNLTPEFEGMRTGLFSRKSSELMVQVALPPEPHESADLEVRCLLRSAVVLAEEFAQREALVDGELSELRELVERV
jgi:hypothetical protein